MSAVVVSALNLYPVKSLAGVAVPRVALDATGPAGDRRWMIVDEGGRFLTQRELPGMARFTPGLTPGGLRIQAPDGDTLAVPVPPPDAPRAEVTVWKSALSAACAPEAAHAWLSERLGRAARLVYMDAACVRPVNPKRGQPGDVVSFADGYPLLLTAEASLAWLNVRLDAPVPMTRFRPNVTITGAAPFAEEGWRAFRIGEILFEITHPCERCSIVNVDPDLGVRAGPQPLKALAKHHRVDGKVCFGVNVIHRGRGAIAVGDPVGIVY
ncbi:MAG: MOSC domain-containing protein [Alphaproteobacteria bacterium]|nr:MOSC domain-containing protein [Alphaproteobacteria bacterium]